jgi:hypothetical protein
MSFTTLLNFVPGVGPILAFLTKPLGKLLVGLILIGGVWFTFHYIINLREELRVTVEEAKEREQERTELHQAETALLKMALAGQEAARQAGESQKKIESALAEEHNLKLRALTRNTAALTRRINELLQSESESTKEWSVSPHPGVVSKCLRDWIQEARGSKGEGSTLTTPTHCGSTAEGVVRTN